jgi:hypothetical protein
MKFRIPASTARAMFPNLKGTILGAETFVDGVCFVDMGKRSIAVVADDTLHGVCTNDRKAIALAMRVADARGK